MFYKWRPALQSPRASLKCRIRLCYATAFAALLWLAETWYPTKQQTKRVESWAARTLGKLYGVKMGVDGDVAEYWRRLHRVGHELLASAGGGIDVCRRRQLHAFAGHVVRAVSGPHVKPSRHAACSGGENVKPGAFLHIRAASKRGDGRSSLPPFTVNPDRFSWTRTLDGDS